MRDSRNDKPRTKRKNGLVSKYIGVVIVPVILITLIFSLFTVRIIKNAMYGQVRDNLVKIDRLMVELMDRSFPGDYQLKTTTGSDGEKVYSLYKGNKEVTGGKCDILEKMKKSTGYDVSIIYYDTRMCTTINDSSGKSAAGTAINSRVLNSIYEKQKAQFYENVTVNGEPYFVYYDPIKNSKGTYVGIYGVAKPAADIKNAVYMSLWPIIILIICSMMILVFISVRFTGSFLNTLERLMEFLVGVEHGKMNVQMDKRNLKRTDELGEASRAAVNMQHSLARLVEYDELTGIYNRRYANKRFAKILLSVETCGGSFAAAIGDIDFFKKVNDTYGHECGDAVLVNTAEILKKNMAGHGFAARWGGEEFLLIFDKEDAENARGILENILSDIRRTTVKFGEHEVKITMSIGITDGDTGSNADQILMRADDHLYYAKTHGRNQTAGDEVSSKTND